jgi:hypothetical protein
MGFFGPVQLYQNKKNSNCNQTNNIPNKHELLIRLLNNVRNNGFKILRIF